MKHTSMAGLILCVIFRECVILCDIVRSSVVERVPIFPSFSHISKINLLFLKGRVNLYKSKRDKEFYL